MGLINTGKLGSTENSLQEDSVQEIWVQWNTYKNTTFCKGTISHFVKEQNDVEKYALIKKKIIIEKA